MGREKKSNEELGYTIPVMRRLEKGRYASAFAKSLEPDKNGQIKVRTSDLRSTSWLGTSVIHVPEGFEIKEPPAPKGKDEAGRYFSGSDPI
ncbi:hypothetical protein LCGC14_0277890 [marine sediment metagenome]|uniref:Uncharacterized protein n=1 Tax=marine sediment metagenome TaxID=412755 RepID=A0A0F9TWR7_9ZZZZ